MKDYSFKIKSNKRLTKDTFFLTLECAEVLPGILAGQFCNVDIDRKDLILRRPFCIYGCEERKIELVYAVVGKGTEELSMKKRGETLKVLLPLGNGFPKKDGKVALLGGGMGAAALSLLAKDCKGAVSYLGFKNAKAANIFVGDFERAGAKLRITTNDGSLGERAFPTELLVKDIEEGNKPDVLYVCGPDALARTAKEIAEKYNIEAYFSGESHMGCGYGVCLVCTCKIENENGVENLRVCKDGPVFDLRKMRWE